MNHEFYECSGCNSQVCIPCRSGVKDFCKYCRWSGNNLTTHCYRALYDMDTHFEHLLGRIDFIDGKWIDPRTMHNFDKETCSVCGQYKNNVHTRECPKFFVNGRQLINIQLGKINFVDGAWISNET